MFKSLAFGAFVAQQALLATAGPHILRRSTAVSNATITANAVLSTSSTTSLSSDHSTAPESSSSSSSGFSTSASSSSTNSSTSSSASLSSTISASNTSSTADSPTCTGCVLQADFLKTLTYPSASVELSTYLAGTITTVESTGTDGTVTTIELTNFDPSATPTLPPNQTNVHLTLTWTEDFAPDVTLYAQNTYIAYYEIAGGLDSPITVPAETLLAPTPAEPRCTQEVDNLDVFPPVGGNHQAFIQQVTGAVPEAVVTLPPPLISYLKGLPTIISAFNGSDIATCTVSIPWTAPFESTILAPSSPGAYPTPTIQPTLGGPPPLTSTLMTPSFSTAPSVIHISASDIRSKPNEVTHPVTPAPIVTPSDTPTKPKPPVISIENHPSLGPENINPESTPGVEDILKSLINNNPSIFINPQSPQTQGNPQPGHTEGDQPTITPVNNNLPQSVAVGNTVLPVIPAQVTGGGVVIGGQTLTPGQVTTLNGVVISVPPGGSSVVIGGSTVAVSPANPTTPPVITFGQSLITANPSGEFIIGTQTLKPGGPILTVDGTTLSIGPSGTIAVVNGVTQTIGGGPQITGPPALTVGDHTVAATVVGGTTQFVLGPGQTLTPGGVLTVDGTTFSLPSGGATPAVVVVNGVTSTLTDGALITPAPVLSFGGHTVSGTVVDGTTQYVLGPGTTLIPGGSAITVSGTTFSLPPGASVIVVNGHTSTLGPASVSATTTGTDTMNTKSGSMTTTGTDTVNTKSGTKTTTTTSGKSKSGSSSKSESRTSSTTSRRAPGNFIASGIGISSKPSQAPAGRALGLAAVVEAVVMGVAGWVLVLL